jgi:hypothetical protein
VPCALQFSYPFSRHLGLLVRDPELREPLVLPVYSIPLGRWLLGSSAYAWTGIYTHFVQNAMIERRGLGTKCVRQKASRRAALRRSHDSAPGWSSPFPLFPDSVAHDPTPGTAVVGIVDLRLRAWADELAGSGLSDPLIPRQQRRSRGGGHSR